MNIIEMTVLSALLMLSLFASVKSQAVLCQPGTSNLMFVYNYYNWGSSTTSQTIKYVSPVNGQVTTVAGGPTTSYTSVDGDGTAARIQGGTGSAFSRNGAYLYLVGNADVRRMSTTDGKYTVTTLFPRLKWNFHYIAVSADDSEVVYWNAFNYQINAYNVNTNTFRIVAGNGLENDVCTEGDALSAQVSFVSGLYYSRTAKFILFASSSTNSIHLLNISTNYLSRFAGVCGVSGFADGNRNQATFDNPGGIVMNRDETMIYVMDQDGGAIRKVSYPSGNVQSLSLAVKSVVRSLTISPDFQYLFYTSESLASNSNRVGVYRVTISSNVVSAFSGSATKGASDGSATTAQFSSLGAVTYYGCGCPPGSLNTGTCTLCPSGTYNPLWGAITASDCVSCEAGKYNPSAGATSASGCVSCSAGKYSGSGASSCTDCGISTYSLGGTSVCLPCDATCNAGYFKPCDPTNGIGTCVACTNT